MTASDPVLNRRLYRICRTAMSERRVETHIFLCVLAYHLLVCIERAFLDQGIHTSWEPSAFHSPGRYGANPSCRRTYPLHPARYAPRTNPLRHLPGAAHPGTHPLTHQAMDPK